MQMSRREFMASTVIAAGAASVSLPGWGADPRGSKPNIVFILADDLGYGDLGCFGQEVILTPNLGRMAAEGVRFTDVYAGSTVCAPSRCCLMTGYHTGHCRVRGNKRVPLVPEDVTVAAVLKQAGYRTALFGKWGLGNAGTTGVPTRQGFDEFFGYLDQGHAHNYYPEHLWHNEEMVEIEPNLGMGRRKYSHTLIADRALEYIQNSDETPFFLYLAFTLPHANNERGKYEGDGMEVPDYGQYKDKDWPNPEKGRAAMISLLDADVGRVLDALEKKGIAENTLVIFSSDNGPHKEGGSDAAFFKSSGPLQGTKRALYEGGIRVPTLALWKGKTAAGATSDAVWAFWDFLPTAAELAGATAPSGLDGQSFLPALVGEKYTAPEYLYWEFHEGGFKQAARSGNWKAVRQGMEGPLELFDLANDIGETNNVAAQQPDMAARFETYLKTARTNSPDWPN